MGSIFAIQVQVKAPAFHGTEPIPEFLKARIGRTDWGVTTRSEYYMAHGTRAQMEKRLAKFQASPRATEMVSASVVELTGETLTRLETHLAQSAQYKRRRDREGKLDVHLSEDGTELTLWGSNKTLTKANQEFMKLMERMGVRTYKSTKGYTCVKVKIK